MPLPTNRTTANTAAEHVDDHNTLHALHNTHPDDTSTHGFANGAALLDETAHDLLNHTGVPGVGAAPAEGRAVLAGVTQLSLPGIEGSAVATNTMAANEIRYSPWYVATPITIDSLWVDVSTAGAAGKLIRIGLYNADGGWNPTTLVTDGAVAADGATGPRTLSTGALALPAGRYLTAVNTDGTPALRGMRGSSKYLGYAVALGASPFITNWVVARAYGAFPSPGDAPTTGAASSSLFLSYVYCRVTVP